MTTRFIPQEFNASNYETAQTVLNEAFGLIHKDGAGLPTALRLLHEQQLDQGFIQDDLSSVIRWRLRDPQNPDTNFIVQYNPRRAERKEGSGRKAPPKGTRSVHGGCFLCRENIRWQQKGLELGYDLRLGETEYVAWMNPFPLMPTHITLAKLAHEPQTWIGESAKESRARISAILGDFLDAAGQLPGFVGFYNGEGAGASIPGHFHFQFFERPEGRDPFPLEQASAPLDRLAPVVIRRDKYPITTLFFRGDRESIVSTATDWVDAWTQVYENNPALSANIIATVDGGPDADYRLYFVPRNRAYSHAPGMVGLIGGLEVLGELVFSTDIEKESLDVGRYDFHSARQTLASVEAPGVENFLSRLQVRAAT